MEDRALAGSSMSDDPDFPLWLDFDVQVGEGGTQVVSVPHLGIFDSEVSSRRPFSDVGVRFQVKLSFVCELRVLLNSL